MTREEIKERLRQLTGEFAQLAGPTWMYPGGRVAHAQKHAQLLLERIKLYKQLAQLETDPLDKHTDLYSVAEDIRELKDRYLDALFNARELEKVLRISSGPSDARMRKELDEYKKVAAIYAQAIQQLGESLPQLGDWLPPRNQIPVTTVPSEYQQFPDISKYRTGGGTSGGTAGGPPPPPGGTTGGGATGGTGQTGSPPPPPGGQQVPITPGPKPETPSVVSQIGWELEKEAGKLLGDIKRYLPWIAVGLLALLLLRR